MIFCLFDIIFQKPSFVLSVYSFLAGYLKQHLCRKSLLAARADNGMCSLSFGETEHCLAMRAFSVAEALKIADAVFCKDKEILYRLECLQKGLVFELSFVNVS